MLKLFANDAFCGETKPIAIKSQRFFEIVNADRNDGYAWFHVQFSPLGNAIAAICDQHYPIESVQ